MANSAAETLIGAVVLIAAGGFLAFAAQNADFGRGGGYEVVAKFRKAGGLNVGSDVRVSGVKVGTVTGIDLDPKTFQAVAHLSVTGDVQLPEDSDAKIDAEGILGGNYIAITPGASEFMLKPGGEITMTQGSVSLIDLLLKFGGGSSAN
ncbi:outer membrane lipid asymmetry maintenance protein MlaD [Paroceanicella profunda]|uniref:Outer membrane lipid asymmetry maintenance protein MlaD n=1 Tax=Paroceanicella profunda TaxID=2579971 RepID=A0A5B8FHZ8_9RHOB|nr:outer membrane lipid asymmetry maintenance protein MlaD [Paroceanicella profunda]QDL92777.1 outer membrane lipid asymmetry maintenance protein MlaD [Paroceanicella profunda]